MDAQDWTIRDKPYDIRERLFRFACIIVRVVQFLHTQGPIARALSYQLLKSGTSAGANYEEATDGSSARDAMAKKKIALRELKETRFRLRVLRATGLLPDEVDPVIQENEELVKVVASIINKTRRRPVPRILGSLSPWILGFLSPWILGSLDSWILGFLAPWPLPISPRSRRSPPAP